MAVDRRRVAFRFAVALAIAAALLFGVGWERVVRNLRAADLAAFAPAVAASLAGMAVTAEGIRVVLDLPARSSSASVARRAGLAARFVRSVVPAGNVGGGAFIAYTVSRREELDVSECLAAVATWEFLNLVASAVVATVGVAGIVAAGGDVGAAPVLVAAFGSVLAVGFVVAVLLARRRERVVDVVVWSSALVDRTLGRLTARLAGRLERDEVRSGLDEFFADVGDVTRDRRRLALAAFAAHLSWLLGPLTLYFSLDAVGLSASVAVVFVTMPLAGFALAVPVPGGIGPFDAAIGGLVAFFTGHPLGALASALVLFRLATYCLHVVVGGVAMWTLGRTVSQPVAQ